MTLLAGAPQAVTFEDPRLFKVIVLGCQEGNGQLYASAVDFDEGSADTSLGHGATLPEGMSEAELCGLGGATLSGVQQNELGDLYTAEVAILKPAI